MLLAGYGVVPGMHGLRHKISGKLLVVFGYASLLILLLMVVLGGNTK
jgi:hypothetical protein